MTSTNYEFDHIAFNKAVRKTIKTGLRFEESDLQLNDPVKKRRIFSEYLKKVLDRVDIVVGDEKAALSLQIEVLKKYIDLEELEDSSDIEDIVKKVGSFYQQAQKSHVSIAVHYDSTWINNCKKNSTSILSSIKNAMQIAEIEDSIEALIRLSRDPMQTLKPFVDLLKLVANDMEKANSEVETRMKHKGVGSGEAYETKYLDETKMLDECQLVIEEVKKNHVIG